MGRVLVLEDEEDIRGFIVINLKRSGYEVLEAENGEKALDIISNRNDIDIAVLDVMLPGIDGFEVCKEIRKNDNTIGIIMLTAKSQELDKVGGLSIGADDYIVKPFSPSELVARIDALIRRVELQKGKGPKELISGPFNINEEGRRIFKNGIEIELTQTEYLIMKFFIENKDQALSREHILNSIWGENYFGDPKIVDVNIRRMRQKIENDPSNPIFIKTIWGYGYRWKEEN